MIYLLYISNILIPYINAIIIILDAIVFGIASCLSVFQSKSRMLFWKILAVLIVLQIVLLTISTVLEFMTTIGK